MTGASGPLDWSLLHGAVPVVLLVLGVVALVALVVSRARSWWLWQVWLVVVVAVGVTLLIALWVDRWWRPFPDDLPNPVLYWIAVGLFGVGLAVARFAGWGWWARAGSIGLLVLVVAMAGNGINDYYRYYPTTRDALGLVKTKPLDVAKSSVVSAHPGQDLLSAWQPPANMPAHGALSNNLPIPGAVSGFQARGAYVYTPPAYLASPRALLPVLVLLQGQPGSPEDWVSGGQIVSVMDNFASTHRGLAPVVVMPDATGSGNPLCMNSRLGQMQTYLSVDVPKWISSTLQVDPDHKHWAVGGYSYGGTCSLQLALNAPSVYPTFVDISGQYEPTLGSHRETVDATFGGDEAAFAAVNPVNLLQTKQFPGTAGAFTVGRDDSTYRPQQEKIYGVAKGAGLDCSFRLVDGEHTWQAWGAGLVQNLDFLAGRLNIANSP